MKKTLMITTALVTAGIFSAASAEVQSNATSLSVGGGFYFDATFGFGDVKNENEAQKKAISKFEVDGYLSFSATHESESGLVYGSYMSLSIDTDRDVGASSLYISALRGSVKYDQLKVTIGDGIAALALSYVPNYLDTVSSDHLNLYRDGGASKDDNNHYLVVDKADKVYASYSGANSYLDLMTGTDSGQGISLTYNDADLGVDFGVAWTYSSAINATRSYTEKGKIGPYTAFDVGAGYTLDLGNETEINLGTGFGLVRGGKSLAATTWVADQKEVNDPASAWGLNLGAGFKMGTLGLGVAGTFQQDNAAASPAIYKTGKTAATKVAEYGTITGQGTLWGVSGGVSYGLPVDVTVDLSGSFDSGKVVAKREDLIKVKSSVTQDDLTVSYTRWSVHAGADYALQDNVNIGLELGYYGGANVEAKGLKDTGTISATAGGGFGVGLSLGITF